MSDLKMIDPFVCTDESFDDEDEATLAAIDAGIRDADAGRFVPSEEARRLVKQWAFTLSTRHPR